MGQLAQKEMVMNTINTSVYSASLSTYAQATSESETTSNVSATQIADAQATSTTTLGDSVEISDEAKALAAQSSSEASNSSDTSDTSSSSTSSTQKSAQSGGAGGSSDSSSSTIDALIEALEKKIAALEKEIASELQASKDDEKNAQNLQLKEALLSSYQAQLSELESQKLESSSA